jgi:hypothetical protein
MFVVCLVSIVVEGGNLCALGVLDPSRVTAVVMYSLPCVVSVAGDAGLDLLSLNEENRNFVLSEGVVGFLDLSLYNYCGRLLVMRLIHTLSMR